MKRRQKQTRGAVVGVVHNVKLLELLHGLLPVTMEGGMEDKDKEERLSIIASLDQNENMIQL